MNQICKKFVFAGAFLTVGLSSVAYADSIFIKTELDVVGNKISEVKEVHFTPTTNVLVVDVAGKKCSFGSYPRKALSPRDATIRLPLTVLGLYLLLVRLMTPA